MSTIEEKISILRITHEELLADLLKEKKAIVSFYLDMMAEIKGYVYTEFRKDIAKGFKLFKLKDLVYLQLERYVNRLRELAKHEKMRGMEYIANVIEDFMVRKIRNNNGFVSGIEISESIVSFVDGELKDRIKETLRKYLKGLGNIEAELSNL